MHKDIKGLLRRKLGTPRNHFITLTSLWSFTKKYPLKVYGSLFKSPRFSVIFPRKPEACPLLAVIFSDSILVHSRRDIAIKRIMISKVHSVPRKQGRRLAGIDFVHFGLESLFAWELRVCMNVFIVSIWNEKEIEIIMRILFRCCSKLIKVIMTSIISSRQGLKTGMDFRGQVWKRV